MSNERNRRRIGGVRFAAAWLGLHALLLQLLLPIFHHPAHLFETRGDLAAALAAFADSGSMPVAHHSDGGDHKPAPSCPLCLSIQHAQAFLSPTAPSLLLPQAPGEALAVAPATDAQRWTNLAPRARAPPLFA
jgi:hypothetical protein